MINEMLELLYNKVESTACRYVSDESKISIETYDVLKRFSKYIYNAIIGLL